MNLSSTTSRNVKTLFLKYLQRNKCRKYATKKSYEVRREFIDFFVNKYDHTYVKSSPVVPFCDPTVPFVNAGMNQFKGVFLGQFSPPNARVVNSQKCIRVSDLDIVGTDGTHHTFFEMLGNWSFGDYYKMEACQMAWELLTGPFGFDRNNLVISYFAGDKNLGIEPDLECRDIWMRIGVPKDNLIARGAKDNFWEMGLTGPCGPCTEIHFREPDGNLIEVWNIVFIQFDRQSNGDITPLPKFHIDTGMGLERITALLQNKKSNYDTDLFEPIMEAIHEMSGKVPKYSGTYGEDAKLDSAYRTLADHSRMISMCLADGVFPCRNLRFKNVLRKSITLSKEVFQCPTGMIVALYDRIAEILGETYPELHSKAKESKKIISHEEESLLHIEKIVENDRKTLLKMYPETSQLPNYMLPGLAEGYKQFKMEMKSFKNQTMPGKSAFKLYDAFGLDEKIIRIIADINQLSVDEESFKEYLAEHKSRHKAFITKSANLNINRILNDKVDFLINNGLSATDDKFKYDYSDIGDGNYKFPSLEAKILSILTEKGDIVNSVNVEESDDLFHFIFNKSNFYCEEGGQCRDIGEMSVGNKPVFGIESVSKIRNVIIHSGKFKTCLENARMKTVQIGDSVSLSLDEENRLSIMQNHTATHLLNVAVKKVLPESVTCQLSSKVTSSGLSLDLAVYGEKLSNRSIDEAQNLVRLASLSNTPVKTKVITGQELLNVDEVTTVPGEVYPEVGLRLVEIDLPKNYGISRELCCGTHVTYTNHLQNFSIVSVRGGIGHTPTIRAVTGKLALQLNDCKQRAEHLYKEMEENETADPIEIQDKVKNIKTDLDRICKGEGIPCGVRLECLDILGIIEKKLKEKNTKYLIELVREEMATVISEAEENKRKFITHFLVCSYLLEPSTLSLTIATQCGINKPILLMGCANGIIKATCQVPQKYVNENFNAQKWMSCVTSVFDTNVMSPTKNQDLNLVAHMKGKKVSLINCESLVASALKMANKYAKLYNSDKSDNNKIGERSEFIIDKQQGQNN